MKVDTSYETSVQAYDALNNNAREWQRIERNGMKALFISKGCGIIFMIGALIVGITTGVDQIAFSGIVVLTGSVVIPVFVIAALQIKNAIDHHKINNKIGELQKQELELDALKA